jgi:hypothetical protein
VQHAGHTEVLHIGEAARRLLGHVGARDRFADQLERFRVFGGNRLLRVELERKRFAADQLRVGHALAAATDGAVGDRKRFLGDAEARGRSVEQRGAGRGRRLADLHPPDLDGEAAPGLALVGRERGVALDDLHPRHRQVELVGRDLAERRAGAGAEVDLAGIDRDHALGIDRQERVDLGERERLRRRSTLRERIGSRAGK